MKKSNYLNFFNFIAFTPLFAEFKKSKYAEKFSLANGLTQDSVLGWKLEDLDRSHEVQDALASNPQRRILFPDNPCHLGFLFVGIQEGLLLTLLYLYHLDHLCFAFLSTLIRFIWTDKKVRKKIKDQLES